MNTEASPRWPVAILALAALVALAIGALTTFDPVAFARSNGHEVAGDVNAISEMRSAGGAILLATLVMLAGLIRPVWRRPAMAVAALLYLGYGSGRTLSVALDGVPHTWLLFALVTELALGLGVLLALRATPPSAALL